MQTLKLSEAIRLGAMIRPKADGFFFNAGASCAMGAAGEAIGVKYGDYCAVDLSGKRQWPWAYANRGFCPECGTQRNIRDIVSHLNNSGPYGHDWTREQIADWVATIEPTEQSTDARAQHESADAGVAPVQE